MFENGLTDLPDALKYIVWKFSTVNHKLPIETGRYIRITRNERACKMCNIGQLGGGGGDIYLCNIKLSAVF